jgi:hypothetical protein
MPTSGSSTIAPHSSDTIRALRISVPRSSIACSANFFARCGPRPNALSTRMPSADSSTVVAKSPSWSWASRATILYLRSNTVEIAISGSAPISTVSPSQKSSVNSTTSPTISVTLLTTRKTPTNAMKRRMVERSATARDSSWPDCQRSWNAIGSRCKWLYRSSRIRASTRVVGFARILRRV